MIIDSALYLASRGFHVFPLVPGTKKPMFRGWTESATCDLAVVEATWTAHPTANIGLFTGRYTNGTVWHGLGNDIDMKNGKNGMATALKLGALLPETYVQSTPTGGWHYFYKSAVPVASTVGKLGPGYDTRGHNAYILGAGSIVPAGTYKIALAGPVVEAPAGLIALIGQADTRRPSAEPMPAGVDEEAALVWGMDFLVGLPVAPDGQINNLAFIAAAILREHGLPPHHVFDLMVRYFKSELPMEDEELAGIANHSAKYAKGSPGALAPAVLFKEKLKPAPPAPSEEVPPETGTPMDYFNKDHAVCKIGTSCFVVRKTLDSRGKPTLSFMGVEAFHILNAGRTYTDGNGKVKPLSRAWINGLSRGTYQGLEFAPGRPLPADYYNLWQGFACEPLQVGDDRSHRALENFKRHILHNMADGNAERAHYITSYFAHICQNPQDKGPVSLVFRGGKGSGKDTALNIFGELLGPHYINTAQGRDLTGQFNSAVEAKLLIVLNEAIWAHDHKAESILKDLVTGRRVRIERKGAEPYWVDNLARVVLMGNADIQVPASSDERRWFVIDMRDIPESEREAHAAFCKELREGMEAGGYPLLLDYLLSYDTTGVNLSIAPNSEGLVDQKMAGLPPVQMWIRECLGAGQIVGSGVPLGWPEKVSKETLRQAFRRWRRDHDISGREPGEDSIGRLLMKMNLGIDGRQKITEGKCQVNAYGLPPLEEAREKWDVFIRSVKPTVW